MIWNNQRVMQFLELYRMNSCIWDPDNEHHKHRQSVNDAWNIIQEGMGIPCTVKELKKKKESLMSAYRCYKNKIRRSELNGPEVYKPTWFAFSFMDSFMGSIYTCNESLNNENEYQEDYEGYENGDSILTCETDDNDEQQQEDVPEKKSKPYKRPYSPQMKEFRKKIDHPFEFLNVTHADQANEEDESDLFGKFLAKKLRKLPEERRDYLICKINNLMYRENYSRTNSFATTTPSPNYLMPSPVHNIQENVEQDSKQNIVLTTTDTEVQPSTSAANNEA